MKAFRKAILKSIKGNEIEKIAISCFTIFSLSVSAVGFKPSNLWQWVDSCTIVLTNIKSCTGNCMEKASTVGLLIKVPCFVKRSCSKLVSTRRLTVLILPIQ
jgi:hypothetical protein